MRLRRTTPTDTPLKLLLHRRMAGVREARPRERIHASDVTDPAQPFCPRMYALVELTGTAWPGRFLTTALRATFDQGHAMQDLIAKEYVGDLAYGRWRCCNCGGARTGYKPSADDDPCKGCGGWRWRYDELRVTSVVSGISAGLDLLVRLGPRLRLYEIKIIDKDEFRALAAPLAEHRQRTALYLRILAESEHRVRRLVDLTSAGILYMGRCFGFADAAVKGYPFPDGQHSPFKEFTVSRDDAASDNLTERARVVTLWNNSDDRKMPAGICSSPTDRAAKRCPVKGACFSGRYPAEITWYEDGTPRHGKLPPLAPCASAD